MSQPTKQAGKGDKCRPFDRKKWDNSPLWENMVREMKEEGDQRFIKLCNDIQKNK